MAELFISYAMYHCTTESVTSALNSVFDEDVVVKVAEAIRKDNTTGRQFKMFWITIKLNQRVNLFIKEIKDVGHASIIYGMDNKIERFWKIRINTPPPAPLSDFKPKLLPKDTEPLSDFKPKLLPKDTAPLSDFKPLLQCEESPFPGMVCKCGEIIRHSKPDVVWNKIPSLPAKRIPIRKISSYGMMLLCECPIYKAIRIKAEKAEDDAFLAQGETPLQTELRHYINRR